MIAIFASIILIIELVVERKVYKSLIAPPVILSLMWLGVHILNILLNWKTNELAYSILILPPLMFNLGFFFIKKCKYIFNNTNLEVNDNLTINNNFEINYNLIYVILLINLIYLFSFLFSLLNIMSVSTADSSWLNMSYSSGKVEMGFFKYIAPEIYLFSGFCGLLYFMKKTKKLKYIYLCSLLIAFIISFLAGNRTSIFMVLVINLFSILLYMNENNRNEENNKSFKGNKKQLIILLVSLSLFLVIFLIIASQKYVKQYSNSNFIEFLLENIFTYYNLSSAAFVEWFNSDFTHTYGSLTLRPFFALLNKLGMDVQVHEINSGYFDVLGRVTNCGTIAKNYIQDFGIFYMIIMLFIFGMLHSYYYKKSFNGINLYQKISAKLICSTFYIGLLFQVLTDQYMIILSMMVNFYIWSMVFPRLIIRNKKVEKTIEN